MPRSRMGRIRQLPPGVVNLIAAGEVVERPASVAKELVENALDAGATRVTVTVEGGGIRLLRVADDGAGMDREDLALAVQAHATSKIADAAGLEACPTFGFRGEALASIGAVALLRIASATADGAGAELHVEAGAVGTVTTTARPAGTTVEVRELFAAVPARRKFLRSERAEFAQVAEVVERAALAHPEVAFELTHNGREVLRAPRTDDRRERAATVLGADVIERWVAVDADDGEVAVFGWVAPAEHAAGGSRARTLRCYVNERPVRDRNLAHAVGQGYRDKLPPNRHPTALLFVTLPPAAVDVNVHPAKTEVRFRDPRRVHDLVAAAIDQALGTGRVWGVRSTFNDQGSTVGGGASGSESGAGSGSGPGTGSGTGAGFGTEIAGETGSFFDTGPDETAGRPVPLGGAYQLCDTYIVEETDQGLVLTDQHALHERLLFDEILERWGGGEAPRQELLAPLPLPADRRLAAAAGEHRAALLATGLELELHPGDVVLVRAVPTVLRDRDPVAFAQGVLADLADGAGDHAALEPRQRLAATLACHAAVTAGHRLPDGELRTLLERRGPPEPGWHCAHGRPAVVLLTHAELRRRFCRHTPPAGGPG